jgi:hypothetical protein
MARIRYRLEELTVIGLLLLAFGTHVVTVIVAFRRLEGPAAWVAAIVSGLLPGFAEIFWAFRVFATSSLVFHWYILLVASTLGLVLLTGPLVFGHQLQLPRVAWTRSSPPMDPERLATALDEAWTAAGRSDNPDREAWIEVAKHLAPRLSGRSGETAGREPPSVPDK